MEKHSLQISYKTAHYSELKIEEQSLIDKAIQASQKAYAPYSKFQVGCAVGYDSIHTIIGNNQENAAYPSGLCAERVALFQLKAKHPKAKIDAVAIYVPITDDTITPSPCGSCRQVISEIRKRQQQSIRMFLINANQNVWIFEDIDDLIPFDFNRNHLLSAEK